MQSSHNGQEPQVWTFKPDDPNPHEEEDQQRMLNQDDELRNEVEEMFNKLPDRSVECCVADGIDPFNPRSGLMQLQHEVSWTFDGKSNQPREDWREQERVDRDNTKRSVANAKAGRKWGGRRQGAGAPKRGSRGRTHGGRRPGAGRPKIGVNGSHSPP